jgi:hypothetical protein
LRSERFSLKGGKLHTQGNESRLERKIWACLEKINCLRDKHIEKYRIFAAF